MESEDRIHDQGKSGKPSNEQVGDLKQTIITGLEILAEMAGQGDESEQRSALAHKELPEAIEAICQRALTGDVEAFSILRSLAKQSLMEAGKLVAGERPAKRRQSRKRKAQAHRSKNKAELPEHPLIPVESPRESPTMSLAEIADFMDARNTFLLARADYERRRASLIYKLHMFCEPEDQSRTADYLLKLEDDGDTLVITNQTGIPAQTVIDCRK